MVYISNGKVVDKPNGVVAVVRAYIAALLAFIFFFFQSISNPTVVSDAKKKDRDRPRRDGDGGGGGRGPRITGLDRITGGSHNAQCGGGG
mmetsp:Transcript_11083/g.32963  ORF Transcript_11083/g.32963 Transcript_11083/m.32963 type:complete len:90 (+) Transcript_11083:211-480(+)